MLFYCLLQQVPMMNLVVMKNEVMCAYILLINLNNIRRLYGLSFFAYNFVRRMSYKIMYNKDTMSEKYEENINSGR